MKRLAILVLIGLGEPAWAQMLDYPGAPTEHGSVTVLLRVTAEGIVDDCHVKRFSGLVSLDSAACPMAKHARFRPDTDDTGQAKPGTPELTFHFIVPHAVQSDADLPIEKGNQITLVYNPARDAAQRTNGTKGPGQAQPARRRAVTARPKYPPQALRSGVHGKVSVVIDVSPDGQPADCSVVRSSGSSELDQATCNFAMQNFRYTPGTDYYGKKIGDVDLFTMNWAFASAPSAHR
jgi:TonB family protein